MPYIIRDGYKTEILQFNQNGSISFDAIPHIYTNLLDIVQQTVMVPISQPVLNNDHITFNVGLLNAIIAYRNITMLYFAIAFEACRQFVTANTAQNITKIDDAVWINSEIKMPPNSELTTRAKLSVFVYKLQQDMLLFVVMLFELMVALQIINESNNQQYYTSLKTLTDPCFNKGSSCSANDSLIAQLMHSITHSQQTGGDGLRTSIYKTTEIIDKLNNALTFPQHLKLLAQGDTSLLEYVGNPMLPGKSHANNLMEHTNYAGIDHAHIMTNLNKLVGIMPFENYYDPQQSLEKIKKYQISIATHSQKIKQFRDILLKRIEHLSPIFNDDFRFLRESDFAFDSIKQLISIDMYNNLHAELLKIKKDIIDSELLLANEKVKFFLTNISQIDNIMSFDNAKKNVGDILRNTRPYELNLLHVRLLLNILKSIEQFPFAITDANYKYINIAKQIIDIIGRVTYINKNDNNVYVYPIHDIIKSGILGDDTIITSINLIADFFRSTTNDGMVNTSFNTVQKLNFRPYVAELKQFFIANKKYVVKKTTLDNLASFVATNEFKLLSNLAKKYSIVNVIDTHKLAEIISEKNAEISKEIENMHREFANQNSAFAWTLTPDVDANLKKYAANFAQLVDLSVNSQISLTFEEFIRNLTAQNGGTLDQHLKQHTSLINDVIHQTSMLAMTADDAKHINLPFLHSLYNQKQHTFSVYLWFMHHLLSNGHQNLQKIIDISRIKYLHKKLAQIANVETFGFCTILMKFIQRLLLLCGDTNVVVVDPSKKSFIWLYVVAMLLAYIIPVV